jgi:hypothetical protein
MLGLNAGRLLSASGTSPLPPPAICSAPTGPLPAAASQQPCQQQQQLQRLRLIARAGKLPHQAETLFNPSDRSEEFVTLVEAPSRSVADLDYLSVSYGRRPSPAAGPAVGSSHSCAPHTLQELLAIQADEGPKQLAFFGTRNMGMTHQKLVEILSYAMVSSVSSSSRRCTCQPLGAGGAHTAQLLVQGPAANRTRAGPPQHSRGDVTCGGAGTATAGAVAVMAAATQQQQQQQQQQQGSRGNTSSSSSSKTAAATGTAVEASRGCAHLLCTLSPNRMQLTHLHKHTRATTSLPCVPGSRAGAAAVSVQSHPHTPCQLLTDVVLGALDVLQTPSPYVPCLAVGSLPHRHPHPHTQPPTHPPTPTPSPPPPHPPPCCCPQGNHIYTSGATGTNAAVIKGALRADCPDRLTVILPQSRSKQPAESRELLEQVGGGRLQGG